MGSMAAALGGAAAGGGTNNTLQALGGAGLGGGMQNTAGNQAAFGAFARSLGGQLLQQDTSPYWLKDNPVAPVGALGMLGQATPNAADEAAAAKLRHGLRNDVQQYLQFNRAPKAEAQVPQVPKVQDIQQMIQFMRPQGVGGGMDPRNLGVLGSLGLI